MPWTETTWIQVCRMLRPDLSEADAIVMWRKLGSHQTETGEIQGYGEEVLCIPVREVRRLCELPIDVVIARVAPPPPAHRGSYAMEWMATGSPTADYIDPAVYLVIQHRYCQRSTPGMVLTVGSLDGFLERYHELARSGR
jgi:hypothetical protein